MIGRVAGRFHRRLRWEAYCASVRARWLLWDGAGLLHRSGGGTLLPAESREALSFREHAFPAPPQVDERQTALLQLPWPTVIEPDFGYPIGPRERVIAEALVRSSAARSRALMRYFSGVPSIRGYFAARVGRLPVRRFPAVALLRQPFDANYYHAMVEVLPRLALLESYGLPSDLPLVVSPALASTRFFRAAVRRGSLANRHWVVQDGFYVYADTVYVPLIKRDHRELLDRFLDLIEAPAAEHNAHRRLFVARDARVGRAVTNMAALCGVLSRHQLESVDTATLSLEEQMNLFRQARLVVGVNGAGLTNILFRRGAPLSLLELFPPHDSDPSFYMLGTSYGYDYEYLVGRGADSDSRTANFEIDPALLDEKLSSMVRGA